MMALAGQDVNGAGPSRRAIRQKFKSLCLTPRGQICPLSGSFLGKEEG